MVASSVYAQTAFEVAAIKPGVSGSGSGVALPPNGRFSAVNTTLDGIIALAYGVNAYQLIGGPDWIHSERFSMTAKAPGDGPVGREQYAPLVQALLADRFQLKVRRETRDLAAYALLVDSNGPKLKPGAPGERASEDAGGTTAGPRAGDGRAGRGSYDYKAATMAFFVTRLGFHLRLHNDTTPVLNKTGLDGTWNFSLPYARELTGAAGDPSVFSVIRDLGLKLEKGRYPVETIVIESAARPTFD